MLTLASGVTSVSAGEWHSCAVVNTEQIVCWGLADSRLGASSSEICTGEPCSTQPLDVVLGAKPVGGITELPSLDALIAPHGHARHLFTIIAAACMATIAVYVVGRIALR